MSGCRTDFNPDFARPRDSGRAFRTSGWRAPPMLGNLHNMKSFNVRHVQHHLTAVLADVERGEVIEVRRRARPVARIVPHSSGAPRSADWSQAETRLLAAYPAPVGGVTATQVIEDGRCDR